MREDERAAKRTALIVYGSETGKAQDVADELGRLVQRLHFKTTVLELNNIALSDLLRSTIVLIAISTTGQGDLPANATQFWKRLRSSRLPANCLSSVRFASFGLGDSSYPQFNWAHRKLYNRLVQLGGNVIYERGEADEQMPEGIDGTFIAWSAQVRKALLEKFPFPKDVEAIPDDQFLTPEWALEIVGQSTTKGPYVVSRPQPVEPPSSKQASNLSSQPLRVTLVSNRRITPARHWQDVRLLDFVSPKVSYEPGDILTVFPRNSAEDVEAFIDIMKWNDVADKPVQFYRTQDQSSEQNISAPPAGTSKLYFETLREYITNCLDINSIPRRSFFAALAHFTDDETQKQRLVEFTDPEYLDELFDYTTRPRRSIIEVLQEFHTVKIPLKWVASVIPSIRGRQFSIASGGNLKVDRQGNGRIQILVAIVKYRTVIRKIREGLCTKYIANLQPGSEIEVTLNKGGMRIALDRPAVMVGPGTGVAPLRAMTYERIESSSPSDSKHDTLLFFGGRNRNADYFFEDEWYTLTQQGQIDVIPAFSRDQVSKVYVQDLIRANSAKVYALLITGVVYICGSSGKMPQAVREALIEVFQKEGQMQRSNAEKAMSMMEKEGRYQQETW